MAEKSVFEYRQVEMIFFQRVQPTQSSVQRGLGGGERLGREADQLSPSVPEIKNAGSYISSFPYASLALSLITLRDNLSLQPVTDVDRIGRTFVSKSITFSTLASKLAETETFMV
jgi:hypothetical protein